MTQYFEGMIWLSPYDVLPTNPKELLKYIKKIKKEYAVNKMVEAMENSIMDFKAIDFEVPN